MTNPLSLDYQVIFEKISNSVSELSILEPLIILIWCIGYTGSCLIEADLVRTLTIEIRVMLVLLLRNLLKRHISL